MEAILRDAASKGAGLVGVPSVEGRIGGDVQGKTVQDAQCELVASRVKGVDRHSDIIENRIAKQNRKETHPCTLKCSRKKNTPRG